ncbi:hypothetical protein [Actinophytocola oryzae]|uniref:Maltokinase n=1 Tax=Actinophytocola oryzae TaxID=502181 RepID=A0A4R7VH45_9PSEU|nr:hypothetical protein [Actinophytocola oryzae]TDV48654.1 maltokinase [Actinophytocola oryzae]
MTVVDVLHLRDVDLVLRQGTDGLSQELGGAPGQAGLRLVEALRGAAPVHADRGGAGVHTWVAPSAVTVARRLSGEHTNTIDLVGERYVVKWYVQPAIGVTREHDLLARLAAEGCTAAPALTGALVWRSVDGRLTTLAVVTEFVPDAEDGWTVVVGLDPAQRGDRLRELASSFGDTLARLHDALGDIHGDVHLGQFLVPADGAVRLVDLEGDPLTSQDERALGDTPLRDLASLRRSFVLAFLWRQETCGDPPSVREVYDDALHVLTETYLAASGFSREQASTLLPELEVTKAAAEIRYAERFLPSWLPFARRGHADAVRAAVPR